MALYDIDFFNGWILLRFVHRSGEKSHIKFYLSYQARIQVVLSLEIYLCHFWQPLLYNDEPIVCSYLFWRNPISNFI